MDEQALKLYSEYRGRLEAHLRAAYDQFDKAILTLSGGALALSIGFIKDVVPLRKAVGKPLLISSWIGFAVAVLLTVVSFLISQRAYELQIQNAQDYYVDSTEDALNRPNQCSRWVHWLNVSAISCFMLAVVLTICFVSMNIIGGS